MLYGRLWRRGISGSHVPIKAWNRACTIVPEFVGTTFEVHNGKLFMKVYVTEAHGRSQAGRVFADAAFPVSHGRETIGKGSATEMAWRATHRYARIAERKARLVADMIRGRRCDEAIALLHFTHKAASVMVDRVLKSAMASANEQEAAMNNLYVSEARVDAGPIIKRFHPKDRGRAHSIHKRTSHIIIAVDEKG